MKIVFLSNYFNHHQKPLSDSMYSLLGNDYYFVETSEIPEFRRKLGYGDISAPYVVKYEGNEREINRLIMDADVVVYGEAPLHF